MKFHKLFWLFLNINYKQKSQITKLNWNLSSWIKVIIVFTNLVNNSYFWQYENVNIFKFILRMTALSPDDNMRRTWHHQSPQIRCHPRVTLWRIDTFRENILGFTSTILWTEGVPHNHFTIIIIFLSSSSSFYYHFHHPYNFTIIIITLLSLSSSLSFYCRNTQRDTIRDLTEQTVTRGIDKRRDLLIKKFSSSNSFIKSSL